VSVHKHGLVLGKFYPPHAGHHHLVRTAASRCRIVTVVVLASHVESIPLTDRVRWLRAEHAGDPGVRIVGELDDHPVDYDDPVRWDAHVDTTAAAVVRACLTAGDPPEAAAIDACSAPSRTATSWPGASVP
jgi:HTH-type transcriptional regulator, transcriptional repressor of NAD biosynthesis genes